MHKALNLRDDRDYMYEEKKGKEDSPTLKITSILQF